MSLPPFEIPATMRRVYVDDPVRAEQIALECFPRDGSVTAVSIDMEWRNRILSKRDVEKLVLPLANLTEPLIRLFIMASQHCVVAFDTLALSGIPPRAIEILEDHNIPKSGFNIIVDCTLIGRSVGARVLHAVDLSNMIKTAYPSVFEHPFSRQISLEEGAARFLRASVSKELQTSDWAAPILSQDQIVYAQTDAVVGIMIYLLLRPRITDSSPFYDASAYAFNMAFVIDGQVVPPGPNTTGATHRAWGVTQRPPTADDPNWRAQHLLLKRWAEPRYSAMRNLTPIDFFSKQIGLLCEVLVDTWVYTGLLLIDHVQKQWGEAHWYAALVVTVVGVMGMSLVALL
ncbi:hypothetical protein K523DRAFT_397895 [Schizophyllum commune Tattone D]|nr:hypothetical protein K523DRAFT_397895 [Schizophyllum commune Tattone D]